MLKRFVLLFAIGLGLLLGVYYTSRFGAKPPEVTGLQAPQFEIQTLSGQKFSLQEKMGKVVFLNYWATWCAPCQEEVPLLNHIYDAVKDSGVEFIALMEDDALDQADAKSTFEKFAKRTPVNYPVCADTNGEIADQYGTFKIPESYVIDKTGKVVFKIPGPVDPSSVADLIKQLQDLAK